MTNRYFTFTGNQVSEEDFLTDKTDTLLNFLDKYMSVSGSSDTQNKLTEGGIDMVKRLTMAMQAQNGDFKDANEILVHDRQGLEKTLMNQKQRELMANLAV